MPSNEQAEKALIGSCILEPQIFDKIIAWVRSPDGFWYNKNKRIWLSILDLVRSNTGIDIITVANKYKDKYSEEIESSYMVEITQLGQKTENAEYHARIVWERHIQREVIKVSRKLESVSKLGSDKIGDLLLTHQRYMEELSNLQPSKNNSMDIVVENAVSSIISGAHIIEWGEKHMDDYAGGLTRSEFSVLGGRPGNGKTTLMVNLIDKLAIRNPELKIMMFNREMSNTSAIGKLIVLNSDKLSTETLRKKKLTNWEKDEVQSVKKIILARYPNLRLYDNVIELDETIREIKRYEPDVIFDDYVQLIKVNGKRRDRRFEIEDIVNEYKWVLKKVNASAVLLSQLSRDIERRMDSTPTMADYAEGGTLEQGAETCMFVYYPYYFDPAEHSPYQNEIIVKKARYGRIGTYPVGFSGKKCRFFITPAEAERISA